MDIILPVWYVLSMKYYFILNPASGTKNHKNDILFEIRDAARALKVDFDVYFTKAAGDAQRFVRETCLARTKAFAHDTPDPEPIRFIGCGGDGTVNELVNGAYGFENVEIGIIPQGTGNDYIRNYGDTELFRSVKGQMLGESRYSDLIEYVAEYQGNVTRGFCANMFNIGFDCNVVDMTNRVKTWPVLKGSMAYLTSVFITLAKKEETSLHIEYGDGTIYDGKVLLISVANGCFCGGGIKGVPKAALDDGKMDVSLVHSGLSRRFFVRLFPKYQKGTHLEDPRIASVLDYRQEASLTITANDAYLRLCVDGEISTQKKVTFTLVPKAIRFIVPNRV